MADISTPVADTSAHKTEDENASESQKSETENQTAAPKTDRTDKPLKEDGKDLVLRAKTEFNKNRKIIIQNVPPVTYEEVKNFIGCEVYNISISKKSRHAIVTLLDGEKAEELVGRLNNTLLLGVPVTVSLYYNENLLCVAHLPFNFTDEDFRSLVTPHGAVERCFLMRSEDTGQSKGYGFVEFSHNKEKSTEARSMLNGRRFGSCILQCDFIHESLVTFESLHSRCLFVDHLPQDYSNVIELRNVFSRVVSPLYCQLGMRSGQPLGFGVVEFNTAAEAEETQRLLRSQKLEDKVIRVTFSIPGQNAMSVYNRQLESVGTGPSAVKPGLLPDPVLPTPLMTNPLMKTLFGQYPQLLDGFQALLQQLQQQLIQQMHTSKPGLLGIAPNLAVNPLMNPNLQVAILAVLVASEMQAQLQNMNQSAMMANPQLQQLMMNMQNVQNLVSQQSPLGAAKPSLLGTPLIAQANFLMSNLVNQLRQQPADSQAHVDKPLSEKSTSPTGVSQESGDEDKKEAVQLDMRSLQSLQGQLQGILLGSAYNQADTETNKASKGLLGTPGSDNIPVMTSDTMSEGGAGMTQQQLQSVLSSLATNQGIFANPVLAGILETQIRQHLCMQTLPGSIPTFGGQNYSNNTANRSGFANRQNNNNSGSDATGRSSLLGVPQASRQRPIMGGTQSMVGSTSDGEYNFGARSDAQKAGAGNGSVGDMNAGTIPPGVASGGNNWRMNNFESQLLMQGRRLQGKGLLGDGPPSAASSTDQNKDQTSSGNSQVERGWDYYYNQDSSYGYQEQYSQQYYDANKQGSGYSGNQGYEYGQDYDYNQYYSQNTGGYGSSGYGESYQGDGSNTGSYGNNSGYNYSSYNPSYQTAEKQDYNAYNQSSGGGYYQSSYGQVDNMSSGQTPAMQNQYSSSQGYMSQGRDNSMMQQQPQQQGAYGSRPAEETQYNEYMQEYMQQHVGTEDRYQTKSNRIREQPEPPGTTGEPYNPSQTVMVGNKPFVKPPPPPAMTPVGNKRRSNHLLPSPEPSPENNYVGQHSQGIGGHYASSYPSFIKKMRF